MVYQTNADLTASHEAMVKNERLVQADLTQKGLLWFKFKTSQTIFQLSSQGKLQVKWNDVNEKKILHKLVKNLLVANSNQKLVIKPLKQQTWIDYPVPPSFKLYWCDEATEYVLKKPSDIKAKEALNKPLHSKQDNASLARYREEAAAVKVALEELRREFRFFREPTLNEVALKSGCFTGSAYLKDYLFLAGWKPPRINEIDYVKSLAEQAINLAGLIRLKKRNNLSPKWVELANEAMNSAQISVIQTAEAILETYPELVPKAAANKLRWPAKTKSKWIEVFGQEPPSTGCWEQP